MSELEFMHCVFDILVNTCGAHEYHREQFIYDHLDDGPCSEWRFIGKLGFGGKYRSEPNRVSCYQEDESQERIGVIFRANSQLHELKKKRHELRRIQQGGGQ